MLSGCVTSVVETELVAWEDGLRLGGVEMQKRGQGSLPERDAGAGDGRDFRDAGEMQVLPGWKTLGLSFIISSSLSPKVCLDHGKVKHTE